MGNVERSLTLVHGAGGGDMLKVETDAVFDQQGPAGIVCIHLIFCYCLLTVIV